MKSYFFSGLLSCLVLLSQPAFAKERPELGNLVYTYQACSNDPTKVSVLRIGPKSNKEFLVQIEGVDHKLNGKALIYKAKDLQPNQLKFSFLNKVNDKIVSSLLFNGSDQQARLYIKGYTGLYTPSGKLPEDISRNLCLDNTSRSNQQFYRLYELQQEDKKKKS